MSTEKLVNFLGIAGITTIFSLIITLVMKLEQIKIIMSERDNLRKSLDEMDEQAKLIIRTDMELNKTQEELDKKISGLYALQHLSRSISTTLEENQVIKLIDPLQIAAIGFEKLLVFSWEEKDKKFLLRLNIGFFEEELGTITSFIYSDKEIFFDIIKNEKTISSVSIPRGTLLSEKICENFKVRDFIIAPILPKEGNHGFIFVGTQSMDTYLTEGDEDLITIFANQIGQALENARLFEKTWLSQQDLEKKVEQRTGDLQKVLNEVRVMSKRKSDFISAVSHELRTPLTSIKGYASILLGGQLGEIPEQARIRIEKINRHSDELTHLVNELLDISRIESGKVTMRQEKQELRRIAETVFDLLSVQFKERQIEFSTNIPEETNNVLADVTQINRVFINLIGNALKFTPAGGKISISSRKLGSLIEISVADTGYGIPQESLDLIFEEFYRVENEINSQVKGTGLGLSLVKHIIEAHGGKISVKSKMNSGSTFIFTLPTA